MEENEVVKEEAAPEEAVQTADETANSTQVAAAVSKDAIERFNVNVEAKRLFPMIFIGLVFPYIWFYLDFCMLKFFKYKKGLIAVPIVGALGFVQMTGAIMMMTIRHALPISTLALGVALIVGSFIAAFVVIGIYAFNIDGSILKVLNEESAMNGESGKKGLVTKLAGFSAGKNYDAFQATLNEVHAKYLEVKDEVMLPEEAEKEIQQIYVEEALSTGNKDGAKALKKRLEGLYKVRNYTELNKIRADYKVKIDARRAALLAEQGGQQVPLELDGKSTFDGTVLQRVGVTLLTCFVTAITLGLAFPAMLCYQMRWECKHTVYNGKRLSFDGTGMQLLGKWIGWLLLSVITFGIYGFFVAIKLEQWKAKHTHIAGETAALGGTFDGGVLGNLWRNLVGGLLITLSLGLAIPYVLCMKERWAARHRIYDGRRLSFDGKAMGLFGQFIKWWLLSIVTLGIYAWWIPNKMLKWKAEHTQLSENQEVAL